MSMRILNRSFSGGEITPELFGRLDLPKVQESLALCRNFITLAHGPAVNRPGTEYVNAVKDSTKTTRLIPFSYNNTQTFAIEVGEYYFRFHTQAATLQYTAPAAYSAATAYVIGDLVSSSGSNYYCIADTTGNAPPNATYWYSLPADFTYEIPNPYGVADLFDIHYTQSADVLTLTHPNYPITELRRYGATNWQTTTVNFAPGIGFPSGSGTAGASLTYSYKITVTYLVSKPPYLPFTVESPPSSSAGTCTNDLTQAGAYNTVTWTPVSSYKYGDNLYVPTVYNVYRDEGGTYYFIGSSPSSQFIDDISRDAKTRIPPAVTLAFAPGAPTATPTTGAGASSVAVTATTGTGTTYYKYVATAIAQDGSESLASNIASCQNDLTTVGNFNTITIPAVAGAVRYNVYKNSNGIFGYIGQANPDLTSGTSACTFVDDNITADISITPSLLPENLLANSGDYPAAVSYYQQRRVFAGSTNQPQNVWATRSGTETDMTYTIPTRDDNRLAFRIAGREASAIRHIVPVQDLLFLSASCEWKCSSSTGVLTPSTLNVRPQSYVGANNVQPVVVGNNVLYAAARGGHIREMGYNWQINGYQSTDASIFAPHLFDYNTIVDMAYSRGPIPILWCVSSTGKLLGMTWLPEQKIDAWHQHDTGNGDIFESICTVSENNEDMLYAVVNRTLNGTQVRCIERLHTRLYSTLADAYHVDCGTTFTAATVSGSYYLSATDTLTCTITGHGLTDGDKYWFYFSNTNYGDLPGGMQYQVAVTGVDTFTISVATQSPLVANQASLSGTIDGSNTAFDLLGASGETVQALDGTPAVYKTDWQGRQLQYTTARTNYVGNSYVPGAGSHATVVLSSDISSPGGTLVYKGSYASPGTDGNISYYTTTVSAGQYAKCAWWVYIPSSWAAGAIRLDFEFSGSGTVLGDTVYPNMSLLDQWQRVEMPAYVAPAGSTSVAVVIRGVSVVVGSYLYTTACELEIDSSSSPVGGYIPTTTAPVTVTDYALSSPAHVVFSSAPAVGDVLTWDGNYFSETGTINKLPDSVSGLTWLEGETVNILADGAALPQQVVTNGAISFPVGVSTAHIGLPITAQIQTPPAAQAVDPALGQGLPKNINKVFLRTYRSSGILAGPDFDHLVPYHQRTTENPGTPPAMVSDEVEIVLDAAWGTSGQICIQQSDPLPLDIAAMILEIATGGGV